MLTFPANKHGTPDKTHETAYARIAELRGNAIKRTGKTIDWQISDYSEKF